MAALPEKRVSHGASLFRMTIKPITGTTNDIYKLSELEKTSSYEKKKQSRFSNNAYTLVITKDLEPASNIIAPYVVC